MTYKSPFARWKMMDVLNQPAQEWGGTHVPQPAPTGALKLYHRIKLNTGLWQPWRSWFGSRRCTAGKWSKLMLPSLPNTFLSWIGFSLRSRHSASIGKPAALRQEWCCKPLGVSESLAWCEWVADLVWVSRWLGVSKSLTWCEWVVFDFFKMLILKQLGCVFECWIVFK